MCHLEIRKVPHFEESHSMRIDGVLCTNERYVNTNSGKPRLVRRIFVKPYYVSRHKDAEESTPTMYFNLYVDGKRYAISQPALMKLTFPELYKPVDNLDGEIWKVIPDFDKYSVSSKGRIKVNTQIKSVYGVEYVDQERLCLLHENENGVLIVRLCNEPRSTSRSVMKLVACAFIRSINDDSITEPKDGNHKNCAVDNISILGRGGYKGDGFWNRGFNNDV